MSVIRINKTEDYTIMSNRHFKEKNMSLKAKGLLSEMLSLPDDWDYSIAGLIAINKENESAIKSTLEELKKFGYLRITKLMPNETETGRIEYVYDIFEFPQKQEGKKQEAENLGVEFLEVENQGQYNTNNKILNNKEFNNIKEKNIKKEKYGKYGRVKLTKEEYKRLIEEFGENFIKEQIELLDEYIETNNNKNKYTNFNLVLRKSIRENWFRKRNEIIPNWFDKKAKEEELTKDEEKVFDELLNNII